MKRTVKKCFGCRKDAFEGEVVIREDMNEALSHHIVTDDKGIIEEQTERQLSQVPKTASDGSSSTSGDQLPSSESGTNSPAYLSKSLHPSRDSSAHSERISPTGIEKIGYDGFATRGGDAIESINNGQVLPSHRKSMEEEEAEEYHQESNSEMGTDHSSLCPSNSETPSTYTTPSCADETSSNSTTNKDKNASNCERSATVQSMLHVVDRETPEERERVSRLLTSDRSVGSEDSQSRNLHAVDPANIGRRANSESESSLLPNRAGFTCGKPSPRSSMDNILQDTCRANRSGESSESPGDSDEVGDEDERVDIGAEVSPEAETDEDDGYSVTDSRGSVSEADETVLNTMQMENLCIQKSSDFEGETGTTRAEKSVYKMEKDSEGGHVDVQYSDQDSCKSNNCNYLVPRVCNHNDANGPRLTIAEEDSENACSAEDTRVYDSSNANSSSPSIAARGSTTESISTSEDDLETDSDDLTFSDQTKQSDLSQGFRDTGSDEHSHTAARIHSSHSPCTSTHQSGISPQDDVELKDETDVTHEENGISVDISNDEGSILNHVLSSIRSVLATFRRPSGASNDEAVDSQSSEPNSGSERYDREDGSVRDDTEETSRSSYTSSSSASSGLQIEDGYEDEKASEPSTQSPIASDGLCESHDAEASDLDAVLPSDAVEERNREDGQAQESDDPNSSFRGEEDSDETMVEDSDHSSQAISSSTVDDETDSDEVDLLSISESQYSD